MNKLWVFGCSFSSGHLNVPKEKSYGNLLSIEMGLDIGNISSPGNSNDIIFNDLIQNIGRINENDYVIVQFTSTDRIGHFTDDKSYRFSTAGIVQLGLETKSKEFPFNQYNDEDLVTLVNYVMSWQPKRVKFDLDNTISILNYLKTTKNIKYSLLCVHDIGEDYNDLLVALPTEKNLDNKSLYNFVVENELTLSDEFPDDFDYYDTHPGIKGHQKIKDMILNQIKTCM